MQDAWAANHFSARTAALAAHPHGSYTQFIEPASVTKQEKRKMHWANTGSLIATAAFIGVAVIGIADKPVLAVAAGVFLVAALTLGIIGVVNSGRGWGLAGVILGAMVILFELAELIF